VAGELEAGGKLRETGDSPVQAAGRGIAGS
ncbi:hypothetical protein GWI33_010827, partial [Rhynchophorus ferrugineus]